MRVTADDLIYQATIEKSFLKFNAVIVVSSPGGIIRYTTPLADSIFGYARRELVGQMLEVLLDPEIRGKHHLYRDAFHDSPRSRPMGHGLIVHGLRKDGAKVSLQIGLTEETIDRADGPERVAVAYIVDTTSVVFNAAEIRDTVEAGIRARAAKEQETA